MVSEKKKQAIQKAINHYTHNGTEGLKAGIGPERIAARVRVVYRVDVTTDEVRAVMKSMNL